MATNLQRKLAALSSQPFQVTGEGIPFDFGQAPVRIAFADGTTLRACYWRLLKDGKAQLSSFDHLQKYGLPEPINAISRLKAELEGERFVTVRIEEGTGDLQLDCGRLRLQVFNFTCYEIWEIAFPDGTVEYSNRALEAGELL
ncbi:MAG: hypothetical protein ACLPX9_01100 [Rhodomicrobium sp.]